jgi:hypothetical protein
MYRLLRGVRVNENIVRIGGRTIDCHPQVERPRFYSNPSRPLCFWDRGDELNRSNLLPLRQSL